VPGKTAVKGAKVRAAIVISLDMAHPGERGHRRSLLQSAACFNPRHDIRATHEGKTVDLVICYECFSLQVFLGDTKAGALTTDSPPPKTGED
jgi:hypothetical protein